MDLQNFSITSLSYIEILIRFGYALFFGLLCAVVFYFTTERNEDRQLSPMLILITLIITMIIIAIGNSIPRAFGLFATLSIIRFRTPIKSVLQLVFIFSAVAIGIAAGSGSFGPLIIGSGFVFITYLVYIWFFNKIGQKFSASLTVKLATKDQGSLQNEIVQICKDEDIDCTVIQLANSEQGSTIEFALSTADEKFPQNILERISRLANVKDCFLFPLVN